MDMKGIRKMEHPPRMETQEKSSIRQKAISMEQWHPWKLPFRMIMN